ncbi:MAG: hypothetical protein AAGC71_18535, partial [Pseudomonadota bacterium]
VWTGGSGLNVLDKALWFSLKPFWQTQDLVNQRTSMMLDLADIFDVPYSEVPAAVLLARTRQDSAHKPFRRIYNFTGDLVMSKTYAEYSDYAVRVADLEGTRRAALLVATLRSYGIAKKNVPQHLRQSALVDPYSSDPFAWEAETASVIFHGLESNERARQEIAY